MGLELLHGPARSAPDHRGASAVSPGVLLTPCLGLGGQPLTACEMSRSSSSAVGSPPNTDSKAPSRPNTKLAGSAGIGPNAVFPSRSSALGNRTGKGSWYSL